VLKKLTEKVALGTGAGSAIGAASARLNSAHGARLALLSHIANEVATIAVDIERSGGEVLPLMRTFPKQGISSGHLTKSATDSRRWTLSSPTPG
jgi:NAD(P)-dependent dehydrogenase (short-subunit alcohol dehydrogenase family)